MGTTPTCPGCGAKFSHDQATKCCTKCGLPDEIIAHGDIALWKKQKLQQQGLSKRQIKERTRGHRRPATRNKHGRVGVKRAARTS